MQALIKQALKILIKAAGETKDKNDFWVELCNVKTKREYIKAVNSTKRISRITKDCLKEIL